MNDVHKKDNDFRYLLLSHSFDENLCTPMPNSITSNWNIPIIAIIIAISPLFSGPKYLKIRLAEIKLEILKNILLMYKFCNPL